MAEYISKDKAVLIVVRYDGLLSDNKLELVGLIDSLPIENVPEIVRCKDCVHYGGIYGDNECSLITSLAQPRVWLKTKPDDFCSSGKRKGDEELD